MNTKARLSNKARTAVILTLACILFGSLSMVGVQPVGANEYEPQDGGHPLRFVAYLVSPLGALADHCLMRPGYWLVQREPFATFFGYKYISLEDETANQSIEKE